MTISEMIAALQEIQDKYGDVYVEFRNGTLVQEVVPVMLGEEQEMEEFAARVG